VIHGELEVKAMDLSMDLSSMISHRSCASVAVKFPHAHLVKDDQVELGEAWRGSGDSFRWIGDSEILLKCVMLM